MKKILFLTRSYSKNKGGKEIYNHNLFNSLNKQKNVELVATGGPILNLIWFYPYALIKSVFLAKKISHIHLGDNFMLPLGLFLKKISGAKLSITLYGLELTYPNRLYQSLFVKPLNNCDVLISISNATKIEAIKKGINSDKIKIIPCGVNPTEFKLNKSKELLVKKLEKIYNLKLNNKKILLTTGRLVKRKGVEWFVSNVMPKLDKDYVYLISGEGPEKDNIKLAINRKKLNKQCFLLGRTDFNTLKILYNSADLFIMPNIHVKGDMEGFGIVILEAGSCGLPVVASNIEGINDAVINGKTGWLVAEKDVSQFINRIKSFTLFDRSNCIRTIKQSFKWKNIASDYLNLIK